MKLPEPSAALAPLSQSTSAVQRLVFKQAEAQAGRLGATVASLSETVREFGSRAQGQQSVVPIEAVASNLAGSLDRASDYLKTTAGEQLFRDLESFGRDRPALAAGVALAAGFAGARLFRVANLQESQS